MINKIKIQALRKYIEEIFEDIMEKNRKEIMKHVSIKCFVDKDGPTILHTEIIASKKYYEKLGYKIKRID